MIEKLYSNKKYGFPLISSVLFITCTIVTIPTAFQHELYDIFAMQSKPFFFWQAFSGIFEHSIFPGWFIWAHFLGNMTMVIAFGILIERLIGSGKMLILTLLAAVSYAAFFQIRFAGQFTHGSGASGIVYAYAPVAIYSLWKFIKQANYNYRKDFLLYLLAFEFLFAWGFVTAVSSWSGTNIYHLLATIIGTLFCIGCKKQIDKEIEYVVKGDMIAQKQPKSKWLYTVVFVPLLMAAVLALYCAGYLKGMFIEPVRISSHDTIQEVINNNNTVEIVFEKPITEFTNISTSGVDSVTLTYSDDKKILYCAFENGIHSAYKIMLGSAYSQDGQAVKDITIDITE